VLANPDRRPARLHGGLVFLIALITGVVGCFLGCFTGDYLTDLYRMPNMEGGRAYFVLFLCAPLGIVAGFIIGLVVALRTGAAGFVGFCKVQGLAILAAIGLATVVTALFWIGADKPPSIAGKSLTLNFELRVPSTLAFPEDPMNSNIYAMLYSKDRENCRAEIDLKSIRKEEGSVIIPGTVGITSHSSERSLMASIGNETGGSQFIPVNLPAAPEKEDKAWSDWIRATQWADLSPIAEEPKKMSLRYRVQTVTQ
jgi:MFS family permease